MMRKNFMAVLISSVVSLSAGESLWPQNAWVPVPDIANRQFWDLQKDKKCIEESHKILREGVAAPSLERYLDFSRDGNRSRYEQEYNRFTRAIYLLGKAACLTDDEQFIRKFEELAGQLCGQPSWVLPAHDRDLANFNKQSISIDLVSSHVAANLAMYRLILLPKLKPQTAELIQNEVTRRVIEPFERMLSAQQPPYWLTWKSNWNVVCLNGVAGTVLASELEQSRREHLLNEVVKNTETFLGSFTPDGYCSEGVSYWNYGFGNYLQLGGILYQASGGKLNLMRNPRALKPSEYPEKIRISDQVIPAFADCAFNAQIQPMWLGVRDWLTDSPSEYWKELPRNAGAQIAPMMFYLQNISPPPKNSQKLHTLPAFSEFPDAGIFIVRPGDNANCRLAAAFKGGSNDELHNHNDVGSYVLVIDGTVPMLVDPGSERYTARTFSSKRYESKLLNSFGHSVPVIAGKLQATGKNTKAKILEKSDSLIKINLKPAYRIKVLKELTRTFEFSRQGQGSLTITDRAILETPETFETALITFGKWEQTSANQLSITYRDKILDVTIDSHGAPFTLAAEEINEDSTWKEKPTRIAIKLNQPTATPEITYHCIAR